MKNIANNRVRLFNAPKTLSPTGAKPDSPSKPTCRKLKNPGMGIRQEFFLPLDLAFTRTYIFHGPDPAVGVGMVQRSTNFCSIPPRKNIRETPQRQA